ncbi:pyridoxamine 5'-phosphate oxidase family protein [Salinarimonas ramus]|uniref:General stress protein n=1 Tax=Salinarimonas ramus TaxID=690164 RepID=A0A917QI72_9HYPH|nr:pyridoxamine 5'-phosphate oxidase family protein [Salinarimonas ramus]GGK51977.1 general stress protein [Salinarimonas ramus]
MTTDPKAREKLFDLIEDIRIAMMTTQEADGSLRSRPMWSQKPDDNGDLWFATRIDSSKTREIDRDHQVGLAYADPDDQDYVSISGRATIVRDRGAIDAHWQEGLRAWFPDGKDDPELAFIKVTPEYGEYWDAPSSKMLHVYGYAKAAITGEPPHPGKEGKVDL